MMTTTYWFFDPSHVLESDRAKLDAYHKISLLPLSKISSGPRNQMSICHLVNNYYVKQYNGSRGGWLRSLFGKSRLENEYANLQRFHQQHIPAPPIVAYGYQKMLGKLTEGVLVTAEIPNTVCLADLHKTNQLHTRGVAWLQHIIQQLADYTRRMHHQDFMFSDLKWRNILVSQDDAATVYLIDCPNGVHVPHWFMWRAVIKDLACLDKVGKLALSRTQRLAFYKHYAGISKLTKRDKRRIKKIMRFFEGRE